MCLTRANGEPQRPGIPRRWLGLNESYSELPVFSSKTYSTAKMIRRETKYLAGIHPGVQDKKQSPMNEQTGDRDDAGQAEILSSAIRPGLWRRFFRAFAAVTQTVVDVIFLLGLLAITASVPLGNVLILGYLLEVQARVARTGKLRGGLFLLPEARRLGTILLGIALWLIPVQLVANLARDRQLLATGGYASVFWIIFLVLTILIVSIHLVMAIGCGGRWWQFLRPLRNARWMFKRVRGGNYLQDAHQEICQFLAAFRFLHLAKIGLLGYAAVYIWLAIPGYMFTQLNDVTLRWQVIIFAVGSVTLTLAFLWLPLLLVHAVVNERVSAVFEHATVRRMTQRVPLRWTLATAFLFALSILPLLYVALIKAPLPPHRVQWDLMLVFLVTAIFPRMLIGLVYHQGMRRLTSVSEVPVQKKTGWPRRLWYFTNVAVLLIAIGGYVYFLNLAATGGELGRRSVWQFHALLLPFPFQQSALNAPWDLF